MSPGPGSGSFGSGPFGRFDWSTYQLVDLIPEIYRLQDDEVGRPLQTFMESIVPSFDYFLDKIASYDDLRDPLAAPIESNFLKNITLLQVDNLGDGTSRVFVSNGINSDKLEGVRVGHVLTDSLKNKFEILAIHKSEQAADFSSPPIDPVGNNPTGRNIIVKNLFLNNIEVIPRTSGYEQDLADAYLGSYTATTTPVVNGSNLGPYTFTVRFPPITSSMVSVTWAEAAIVKVGYFLPDGRFFGDMTVGSSIDFTTGIISFNPKSGAPADNSSPVQTDYVSKRVIAETEVPVPTPNGVIAGPHVFTVRNTPLVASRVDLYWTEFSSPVTGHFDSSGTPDGVGLHASSTINFTTGQISMKSASGTPIDSYIKATYLSSIVIPPENATITAHNLLSLLAEDYGLALDRHDPEAYQRSFVYNLDRLWDLKGTSKGYEVMGQLAGYSVTPKRLWRVSKSVATGIGIAGDNIFFLAGERIFDEVPQGDSISPIPDGISLGPIVITLANAIYRNDELTVVKWKYLNEPRYVTFDSAGNIGGPDAGEISGQSISHGNGIISLTFYADAPLGMSVTYTPGLYYTDLAPSRPIYDDVIGDVITTDLYCFDADYPSITQSVNITSVTQVATEGTFSKYLVVASTSSPLDSYNSFGTEGVFTDSAANVYVMSNFEWASATSFRFTVTVNPFLMPAIGVGSVKWSVLKNTPQSLMADPGTTNGATISPAENGVALGPFSIQLPHFPLDSGQLTISWAVTAVARSALITGTSTIGGVDAGLLSAASINRTTGVLSLTFAGGSPPDTDSIRIAYTIISDLSIVGVGTDVTAMGIQYFGYTGIRYKLRKTFIDSISIGNIGNWKLIDSAGVQSWIEKITLISSSPYVYDIEFVSDSVPASGPANIFYSCEISPSCSYCAASAIRLVIRTNDVLNYPDALAEGAAARLIGRLKQMLPAHARFASVKITDDSGLIDDLTLFNTDSMGD